MTDIQLRYIDSDAGLLSAVESLSGQDMVAVDTEFVRETTYYPAPALLQLYASGSVYLVDPVAVNDVGPLQALFRDSSITKVMHSCMEDLEVFNRLLQTLPQPLFDTQVAAALVGLGHSLSYSKLVEHYAGEVLDKAETRSNWLQRPLTESQCRYAAEDVFWLPDIYRAQQKQLESQQRKLWCEEECYRLLDTGAAPVDPQQSYLRLKAAWKLSSQAQYRLRELCAWRELQAIEQDVPRSRIVADSALLELAQNPVKKREALSQVRGIGNYTVRKYGDALLAILQQPIDSEACEQLVSLPDKKSRQYRDTIKAMQKVVGEVAEAHELPVEILGRRRDLEDYLHDKSRSLISTSWRAGLVSAQLDAVINSP